MTKHRQLLMLALAVALIPAATSAEATPSAATVCGADITSATSQVSTFTAISNLQSQALGRADQRLSNLISQAQAQNQSVAAIVTDRSQLEQRTSALATSYAGLMKAVTATGTLCGSPDSHTAALAALAATRTSVTNLTQWYTSRLKIDLSQLAGGGK